jgi:hypothetical protein
MKTTAAAPTTIHGTWTLAELEAYGGHTPECEQFCYSECPIGIQKRYEANQRAAEAQALWTARGKAAGLAR